MLLAARKEGLLALEQEKAAWRDAALDAARAQLKDERARLEEELRFGALQENF